MDVGYVPVLTLFEVKQRLRGNACTSYLNRMDMARCEKLRQLCEHLIHLQLCTANLLEATALPQVLVQQLGC